MQERFSRFKEDEEKPKTVIYRKKSRLLDSTSFFTKSNNQPLKFIQNSDVKPKTDKKVLIKDLFADVEQPNLVWKVNRIAQQLQQSLDDEKRMVTSTLNNFLEVFERDICPFSKIAATETLTCNPLADNVSLVDRVCVKINDMTRGNLQRSNLSCDLFKNSKLLLMKMSNEHKDRVALLKNRMRAV
ncbi:hypothetical protein TYRP_023181 [Tyrophagus putrescentiae]|nr:hypothetical protein TYRP_023181 [Tyrophagus putrescentiae]